MVGLGVILCCTIIVLGAFAAGLILGRRDRDALVEELKMNLAEERKLLTIALTQAAARPAQEALEITHNITHPPEPPKKASPLEEMLASKAAEHPFFREYEIVNDPEGVLKNATAPALHAQDALP